MRVGLDGTCRPGILTLDFAHEQGLDGVFFRSPLSFSPTLDAEEIREGRDHAARLGLYLELGVGRVNPYTFHAGPEVSALGDGDYRRGLERLIRACRDVDCTELWCFTGVLDDRFNPAVPWAVQLDATAAFLASLAPMLRDLGCRLNLETHEEITTFELVRLVETVGPDVLGVCLDTANLLVEAEDPAAAVRRVASYVHQTHVMDAIISFVPGGLERQARPCGEGVLDWDAIIETLAAHDPGLALSIENRNGHYPVPIFDPAWQAVHPDLTTAELIEVVRLARVTDEKIRRGEWVEPGEYERVPWANRQPEALLTSARYLRAILSAKELLRS